MVDLLNQAKNIIQGKGPNTEKELPTDNRKDRIDQCKVIWYQWAKELPTDSVTAFNLGGLFKGASTASNEELAKARSYDISNHIQSFTYTKNMANASGSFELVLENTFDWARFMRPGQWFCVFLSGDGSLPLPTEAVSGVDTTKLDGVVTKPAASLKAASNLFSGIITGSSALNSVAELPLAPGPKSEEIDNYRSKLRCIGIIQRVGVRSNTNIDGVVEVSFSVTGKDFGGIFEDTELWFNANNADSAAFSKAIEAITKNFERNLTSLLDKWYDIFISPNAALKTNTTISNTSSFFPEQWVLPDRMVDDLKLSMKQGSTGTFGDVVGIKEFNATIFENPNPNPLSGLQGRMWDRLRSLCQPEFHELFTELSDNGNPKIIFRPIPWATDKSNYPVLGKVMLTYKDLTSLDPVQPPLPVGTVTSFYKTLSELDNLFGNTSNSTDIRVQHSVNVSAVDVENFDVGPDYHSRANFFLVDTIKSMNDQVNAIAIVNNFVNFPFRDENDIKRNGFRPMFVNLSSYLIENSRLYGNSADRGFIIEVNNILKDFYQNAEDFYSGSMNLAGGKNEIKLGKVILTDSTFQGISEMVFYIEGYTDSFSVSANGVCSWTQAINLTRGMQLRVLDGASSKDIQATKASTFHTFNKDTISKDSLGGLKDVIKKPFKGVF